MGLFSKARGRRGPNVDLLAAAFGLPFTSGGRADGKNGRIRIEYDSGDDEEDELESQSESSAPSDDEEEVHAQRRSSQRKRDEKNKKEKKSLSKRRHYHRHHRRSSSSLSNSKRSSTSFSTSRRPSVHAMPKHVVASCVRPSATFPPPTPLHVSRNPCTIPASASAFSASNLSQSFGAVPVRPQQPVYYQTPVAFIPSQPSTVQVPVQTAQYLTSDTAQPVAAPHRPKSPAEQPKERSHGRTISDLTEDSGPYAKELQRIQRRIDGKMTDISKQPANPFLRQELRSLQDKLNSTLNKAISGKATMHARLPSTSTIPDSPLIRLKSPQLPSEHVLGETRITQRSIQRGLQSQREQSPGRREKFHFCSHCGVSRSDEFHDMYPYPPAPGGMLKISVCQICQDQKIKRGVAEDYHFCFNCGSARSREFHREHPILPGEPILRNYCVRCRMEVQGDIGLVEMSVLGTGSPEKRTQRTPPESYPDDEVDSMIPQCASTRGPSRVREQFLKSPVPGRRALSPRRYGTKDKKHRDRDQIYESPVPKREASSRRQEARYNETRGRRPEPLSPNDARLNHGDVSPFSPDYSTRVTGSAGRRAQRRSSGQRDAESIPRPEKPANYRAPYIEDLASGHHSRGQTPTPFEEEYVRERGRPSSGLAKEKSPLERSGRAKEQPSEHTRPREASIESDRSGDSIPTSSKSSGSKTVRFKKSVDIRTTLPTDTDASEAEADTPLDNKRYSRPPSSPLISRQKSGFDNSREKDKDEREYLHPHRDRSSMKSPGSTFRTPESFRTATPSKGYSQGAFSRDFDRFEDHGFYSNPRTPQKTKFTDESEFRSPFNYTADESKEAHNPYEEYLESTTSLPSFLPSGGGFSSFFNKSKNKAPTTPGSRASPFGRRHFGHDFNETAGEHQEGFGAHQSTEGYGTSFPGPQSYTNVNTAFTDDFYTSAADEAGSNPYYTPRKPRYPGFPFYSAPDGRSEKSGKQSNAPSSPGKPDEFYWNNGFNPVPIVEEAGSFCEISSDCANDLLEYHALSDASSIETDDDEDGSDRDFSTSDEDTYENIATDGKIVLQSDGDSA
ncbi:hypothetical protein CDV31_014717 [Fusarium ambrosium]|uniref:Uncharacterized protein n=1 Tax=Fusarium ambrosium TaxID=131363 RepID=A0A428SUI4_9HYPO|nr:hypothetical protein CDV31_014717 [Fusarium ambrosium]